MAKTLVTHINPHLDDISAIWLYKKFVPGFEDASLEFISASRDAAINHLDGDRIFIGTGGGQFDEHKGDLEDCATSLVWRYIVEKGFAPKDEVSKKALDRLVAWNILIDLGRMPVGEWNEFGIAAFIRPKDGTRESSRKASELGREILDRVLEVLKRNMQAGIDWKGRQEFESKFGKSFAISSSFIDREFCRSQGGELFLIYDPKNGSVQYFTPSEIDLEPIFTKVKELDPRASWFLHQSHHMVICGSGSAPDFQKTKLSFKELIEVSKSV